MSSNAKTTRKASKRPHEPNAPVFDGKRPCSAPRVKKKSPKINTIATQTLPATAVTGICSICLDEGILYPCGAACKGDDKFRCAQCVIKDQTFTKHGEVKCSHCRQTYTPSWLNDSIITVRKMLELNRAEQTRAELSEDELCEAVPALFALPGDIFLVDDQHDGYVEFEYEGRTTDNWLIFQISDGEPIPSYIRDVLEAYPITIYALDNDDGTPDPTRVKLPPSMCYMFRVIEREPEESELIFEAIRIADDAPVKQLLEQDPELVNYRSQDTGCPVSHFVVLSGNGELQRLILANPRTDVNAIWSGNSILSYFQLTLDCLELILAREDFSQINYREGNDHCVGCTALHYALSNGHVTKARLLINDPRIDLTIQTPSGKTALDIATEKEFTDIVTLIREKM